MGMLDYIPLNSFNSVAKNATANLEIPAGSTIDEIMLEYNFDATAGDEFDSSHLPGVRLNLNGEDIVDVSGADLEMLESYKNGSNANGYIVLPLAEIVAKTFDGLNMTGLVTLPGDAISLEVDIGNAKATSNNPTLKAFARFSETRGQRLIIPKIRKFSYAAAVAGDYEITNLPRGPRYRRLHFGSANVSNLKVLVNRIKRFDMSSARNDMILSRHGRTPQTGYFHFDPIHDGYQLAHMMITEGANSMEFTANMSGAGSVPIVAEYIETVNSPRAAQG